MDEKERAGERERERDGLGGAGGEDGGGGWGGIVGGGYCEIGNGKQGGL